jgi:hypothetical protein
MIASGIPRYLLEINAQEINLHIDRRWSNATIADAIDAEHARRGSNFRTARARNGDVADTSLFAALRAMPPVVPCAGEHRILPARKSQPDGK